MVVEGGCVLLTPLNICIMGANPGDGDEGGGLDWVREIGLVSLEPWTCIILKQGEVKRGGFEMPSAC